MLIFLFPEFRLPIYLLPLIRTKEHNIFGRIISLKWDDQALVSLAKHSMRTTRNFSGFSHMFHCIVSHRGHFNGKLSLIICHKIVWIEMAPSLCIKILSKASDLDFQNQTSWTTCEFSLSVNLLIKSGLLNEKRPEIAWKNGQNRVISTWYFFPGIFLSSSREIRQHSPLTSSAH